VQDYGVANVDTEQLARPHDIKSRPSLHRGHHHERPILQQQPRNEPANTPNVGGTWAIAVARLVVVLTGKYFQVNKSKSNSCCLATCCLFAKCLHLLCNFDQIRDTGNGRLFDQNFRPYKNEPYK
jgi:hypothetical protein